jgi:uncharacterized protein YjaG (DUF416 family)
MDQYRKTAEELLKAINTQGKILFAVLTSEKLYPNYVIFKNINHWGNELILKEAISTIYQYLIKQDIYTNEEIQDLIIRVDRITPDTEDFPGILTSFALDACTAVFDTLRFIIDQNDQHIVDVAIYARDTVDMFIQEKDDMNSLDPSIDIQIEHDEFMIREKERQKNLIERLSGMNLGVLTNDTINGLKTSQSIIDLSLLPKS